jgi:hypothetical protein
MVSTRLYPARSWWWLTTRWWPARPPADRNQTRYDWQHYVPLIERKPGALRNGAPFADLPGPRNACARPAAPCRRRPVMAQVLA